MPPPATWDNITAELDAIYALRRPLIDTAGDTVKVHYGRTRRAVYWYPVLARDSSGRLAETNVPKRLRRTVRRADSLLRDANRVGEADWLDRLLLAYTGLSIIDIGDLTNRKCFCPRDVDLQWVGLDRFVRALRTRCKHW